LYVPLINKDNGEVDVVFPYLEEDDVLPVVDAATDTGVRTIYLYNFFLFKKN